MCRLWRCETRTARLESTSSSKNTFSRGAEAAPSLELWRIGLLRRLLRLALLRACARLPAAGGVVQARRLADFRILRFQCLEGLFRGLGAGGAAGSLDFVCDLGHFRGDLLPYRRAVEL